MDSLIQVSKAEKGQLPLSTNSIYKFHCQKKYPAIILKVAGKLFFDMAAWNQEVEKVRAQQVQEAEDLRRGVVNGRR